MSKDKEPDSVTRSSESSVPFVPEGLFPTIHHTTIEKDGNTYTGTGWTEKDADRDAGERYSEGKQDK